MRDTVTVLLSNLLTELAMMGYPLYTEDLFYKLQLEGFIPRRHGEGSSVLLFVREGECEWTFPKTLDFPIWPKKSWQN